MKQSLVKTAGFFSGLIAAFMLFSTNPLLAENNNKKEIEINRSVLSDLENYTPPDMFGSSSPSLTKPAIEPEPNPPAPSVITRPQELPAAAPNLTQPTPIEISDDIDSHSAAPVTVSPEKLLQAPVRNKSITLNNPPNSPHPSSVPAEIRAENKNEPKNNQTNKDPIPPVPAKKPSAVLGSVKKADTDNKAVTRTEPIVKKTVQKAEFDITTKKPDKIKEESLVNKPIPEQAQFVPAPPVLSDPIVTNNNSDAERYIPKQPPTMPAVPTGKVDAFSLPLNDDLSALDNKAKKSSSATPEPFDKSVDRALENKMVDVDAAALVQGIEIGASIAATAPVKDQEEKTPISSAENNAVTIEFKKDVTELNKEQKSIIKKRIIAVLREKTAARVSIMAYASVGDKGESGARRVSLSRSLAIRSYLLENKVPPQQMNIRALGNNSDKTPLDRVDLAITTP